MQRIDPDERGSGYHSRVLSGIARVLRPDGRSQLGLRIQGKYLISLWGYTGMGSDLFRRHCYGAGYKFVGLGSRV